MIDNSKEYILCAAVLRKEPRKAEGNPYRGGHNEILNIEIGYRHHDIWERFYDELKIPNNDEPDTNGFYTSKGRFVNREEAMKIAYEAGQVDEKRAKWTQEDIDDTWLPLPERIKAGDFKPLASEDLYCCSPDGNSLNE